MTVKSPNLDIAHLDANADQPEVVVNTAIDAIDAKITDAVVVAFGSNTVSLSQDQQVAGSIFHLTTGSPGPTGACTLDFAAFGMGNFTVINDLGQACTLQISGQPLSAPVIADGTSGTFASDGTNVRQVGAAAASSSVADIGFLIDGGGSAIATGLKGYIEVPFNCTINRNTQLADQTGSIVVNIWKCSYANFNPGTHPVAADKITASAPPTISSGVKSQDNTLTGWTTAITAGDILAFNVDSVTTIQRVTLSLKVTKT